MNKSWISFFAFTLFISPFALATSPQDNILMTERNKFSTAINDIQKYYVYPKTTQTLFENALQGMLSSLDPHSAYLNKEEWRGLQDTTQGNFAGVGLEVTMKHGLVSVITPLQGSPAAKAGLQSNDTIIRLNGEALLGLTLRMALDKLRGPEGSTISLDVLRKGNSQPLHFVLTRENIKIQSVKTQLLDENYGYLQIALFQATTYKEMNEGIAALKKQAKSLQGFILDLRDNPGGLLDSAVDVADAFIDGKKNHSTLIVYTKGRGPWAKFTAYATPGDVLNHVPIIVLINEGSASGAEIVAGALKDDHRALLMGTKSFGKGSVQMIIPLDNTSAIRLTTALYYTPNGVSIQARGITPDITVQQVSLNSADFAQSTAVTANNLSEAELPGHLTTSLEQTPMNNAANDNALMAQDYQLAQALNVLKGMALTGVIHD